MNITSSMPRPFFAFLIVILAPVLSAGSAQVQLKSYEENGLYGFQDAKGAVIIPAQYNHVEDFTSCGIAAVVQHGKWAFIDKKGAKLDNITPYIFDNGADYFVESLARYTDHGKIGFIDGCGHTRILAQFDGAFPFSGGRAEVCHNCKSVSDGDGHSTWRGGQGGTIDSQGKLIIPFH